jgi:predicted ATPase
VLQIVGEPGVGKSRLIDALKHDVRSAGGHLLEGRCSPYSQHSALQPFIDLLQRICGLKQTDFRATHYRKLTQELESFALPVGKFLPLLGRLLNLVGPDPFPTITPQQWRERTLEALSWLLTARAKQSPTVLIMEDLQWADPSTLELTEQLTCLQESVPLLVILSHRNDFELPWKRPAPAVRLNLGRLTQAQSAALIHRMAGKALPHDVLRPILAQTEGIPLFVEELTQAVLEASPGEEKAYRGERPELLPSTLIPDTLFDALMPRFDRLGEALPVAQTAAVLGREFSYALLEAVASQPKAALQHALERLQAAQLLFAVGDSPERRYLFKHSLIRDAAYHSLLKSQQPPLHARVARMLETQFPEIARRQPELLATHYQAAAQYEPAIDYWHNAGQRALEHSAHHEAISHFKHGLALLPQLPDTAARQQKELLLQSALGVPLTMTQGYGTPEVERTYARALELSSAGGESPQHFAALRGLWVFYLIRAEYQTALKLSEQLLDLAAEEQDPALGMEAYATRGITLFYGPDLTQAHTHVGKALRLYEPQQHRRHVFRYGQDLGVMCGCYDAWIRLLQGYPAQAQGTLAQTLQLAQRQAHPLSLVYALSFDVLIDYESYREPLRVEEKAHTLMTLSQTQGFPFWLSAGIILEGWAWVVKGQEHQGIARMEEGIALWRATGAELARTLWLSLLAEAYGIIGQAEQGLASLAEAFLALHQHGEHFYEAELYRLQGALLLRSAGAMPEAENCFQQARAIARQRKTKLLELRAALCLSLCLSRLWKKTGQRQAAQQLLSEIYRRFTEGFDTADLKKAKALLNEL